MATQVTSDMITDSNVLTQHIANQNVTPAKLSQPLTQGTAVNTTSGTSVDITGIPSWAKRITVLFNGISTSGTSAFLVQTGSGSIQTTSYVSGSTSVSTSTANSTGGNNTTAGFTMNSNNGASAFSGIMTIANITGNIWASSHNINTTAGQIATVSGAGVVTLSGAPDRIRLTTVNGTDTFDAGSINILYE